MVHRQLRLALSVSLLQTHHAVGAKHGVHGDGLVFAATAAVAIGNGPPMMMPAGTSTAATDVHHAAHGAVTPVAATPRARPEAPEQVQEGLPEAAAHEAVRDRIAAGGGVRQQLEETDGRVAQIVVHGARPEQGHRVDDVQGRPAQEELQHDHEQHLDDALLVHQTLLHVGPGVCEREREKGETISNRSNPWDALKFDPNSLQIPVSMATKQTCLID